MLLLSNISFGFVYLIHANLDFEKYIVIHISNNWTLFISYKQTDLNSCKDNILSVSSSSESDISGSCLER